MPRTRPVPDPLTQTRSRPIPPLNPPRKRGGRIKRANEIKVDVGDENGTPRKPCSSHPYHRIASVAASPRIRLSAGCVATADETNGSAMPDLPNWWWYLGRQPARRQTTKQTPVKIPIHCMVCGQPYSEHTPQELASGCKRKEGR